MRLAQLDPADLAGDGLGQLARTPAAGCACTARGPPGSARRAPSRCRGPGSQPAASTTYAFGTASRSGSGAGTTAASATASCSSRALSSSNGRDLVVGGLEDVVGAADVGDVAVGVARADVAGAVVAARHGLGGALGVARGSRSSGRPGRSARSRADLALVGPGSPVTGSSSSTVKPGLGRPMEPVLSGWPGVLATWTAVSVWPKPSRMVTPQARRTCSMTSGLSGSPAATTSRGGVRSCAQVGLDEHAPHGRRGAEAGDAGRGPSRPSAGPASKRRVVVDEDGRLGVPRREEVATRRAWPSRARRCSGGRRRAAARSSTWWTGGPTGYDTWVCSTSLGWAVVPGGEVEHQRVVRRRSARPGAKRAAPRTASSYGSQPSARAADRDPGVVAGHVVELRGVRGPHDRRAGPGRARSGRAGRPGRAAGWRG